MTKLKAKKPTTVDKRLKMMLYGGAGSGKTTASISFPNVYLIDTERGAENDEYVQLLESRGGVIYQTTDYNEIMDQIHALLTEKHEYKTLVIDPLTTVFNDLADQYAAKIGTDFAKHVGEAGKAIKRMMALLLKLDMNVIITSHSRVEYGQKMEVLGNTFDCYKKMDYLFDLVLEVQKRGKQRVAVVKKSRIKTFPDGDSFEFSYDEIANRYGKDILEREAKSIEMITEEQVKTIKNIINEYKIEADIIEKWLKKAEVEELSQLTKDQASKIINHYPLNIGENNAL